MSSQNIQFDGVGLWDELYPTDPKFVKRVPGGARLSSIDAMWRVQRMTETFGPIGYGWGYETEPYRIEQVEIVGKGGEIKTKSAVFVRGRIWWTKPEDPDKKYFTAWHTGGTEIDQFGMDDCVKSAETDAFGKAASWLGLAADVYMGQHDGDKYQKRAESRQSAGGPPAASEGPSGASESRKPVAQQVAEFDAEGVVLWFGKHNGKTLGEIKQEAPGYLEWLKKNYEEKGAKGEDQQVLYAAVVEILSGGKKGKGGKGKPKGNSAPPEVEDGAPW